MHGRKKVTQSDAEKKIIKEKADTYQSLISLVLERKRCNDTSVETLLLIEKILKNNPDFYILWNFRRNILVNIHGESFDLSIESVAIKVSCNHMSAEELKLSEVCIKRNPKSYCAWFHRKWIFDRFDVDSFSELQLCSLFLKEDQRNFHCWNYRRYVSIQCGCPVVDEFDFSTEKIVENFSNYSAFHHRSIFIKLLPSVQQFYSTISIPSDNSCFKEFENIISHEFSIIENAIFTEPDDQSAWWYHQFLLSWLKTSLEPYATDTQQEINYFAVIYVKLLFTQKTTIQSLLDLENKNKWALACLVNIYEHILKVPVHMLLSEYGEPAESSAIDLLPRIKGTQQQLLLDLIEIDPSHKCRYNHILRKT